MNNKIPVQLRRQVTFHFWKNDITIEGIINKCVSCEPSMFRFRRTLFFMSNEITLEDELMLNNLGILQYLYRDLHTYYLIHFSYDCFNNSCDSTSFVTKRNGALKIHPNYIRKLGKMHSIFLYPSYPSNHLNQLRRRYPRLHRFKKTCLQTNGKID